MRSGETRRLNMGEFLSEYGFFILIALLMVGCHLLHGHGGHGGHGEREEEDKDDEARRKGRGQSGGGGHQH
jgi:hypothetical protein